MSAPAAPPGWYRRSDGLERWWDGTAWTAHERVAPVDPSNASAQPSLYTQPFEPRGGIRWGLFEPVWSTVGGICLIVVALPLLLFALLSLVTGSVLSAVGMGLMGLAFIGCGVAFLYDASVGRRLRRASGR
ncbi:DUF2510 domain-containing protein [Demequina activiva]|uniref:DUF2510 domain-containing protein n=1 Tax=Demequina activiva TaxID=1582364 RepID=A0A919Q312_9MICO|nr:DUF2510 domain-containing protein [Demequina activiva]GIG54916.1 hypothetical protein Dac01nite_16680 [Demequina activiva]